MAWVCLFLLKELSKILQFSQMSICIIKIILSNNDCNNDCVEDQLIDMIDNFNLPSDSKVDERDV